MPENAGLPKEVIDKVKAQHPSEELRMYTSEDGNSIICKAPSRGEYKRFKTMVLDPGQRPMALETLLIGCVVYPTTQDLLAVFEKRPGLTEVFAAKLTAWAGAEQEVVEKKL